MELPDAAGNVAEKTGATVASGTVGLVGGVMKFIESMSDAFWTPLTYASKTIAPNSSFTKYMINAVSEDTTGKIKESFWDSLAGQILTKSAYSGVGGKDGVITQASRTAGTMLGKGAFSAVTGLPISWVNLQSEYGEGMQYQLNTGAKFENASWGSLIPAAYGGLGAMAYENLAPKGLIAVAASAGTAGGSTAAQALGNTVAKGDVSLSTFKQQFEKLGGLQQSIINAATGAVLTLPSVLSKVNRNNKSSDNYTISQKTRNLNNQIRLMNIKELKGFKAYIENSDFNKQNLIEGIIKDIPNDLDDLTKSRLIYIKLNQTVSYSDTYIALGKGGGVNQEMANIYSQSYDISNMTNNNVVCNNWTDIYIDLLKEAGIDEKNIIKTGSTKIGSHQYATVNLGGGNILLADGTNNINGVIDTGNVKLGQDTGGFIITTQAELKNLQKNGFKTIDIQRSLSAKNKKLLEQIDDAIGYSSNQYKKDLQTILDIYNNDTTAPIDLIDKMNTFTDLYDSKDFSAVDAFGLMRNYCQNFFGEESEVELRVIGKNLVDIIKVPLDNGNKAYLYKVNNNNLEFTYDIDAVIRNIH